MAVLKIRNGLKEGFIRKLLSYKYKCGQSHCVHQATKEVVRG
jgi:hypothetical protein